MADLNDITIGLKVDDGDVVRSLKTFERMKRQIGDLILAERKGEITKKQYNRAIQQMGTQLGKVTKDVNGAKSAIQKYAYAVKDATDEQLKMQVASGKGMRRFELIAQQAGYQFGDLAVQIQSGTNAAVALGQQGSQLLGFFGPYGALAGAGLAIVTGLVAPLLRTSEAAKEATSAVDELQKKIASTTEGRLEMGTRYDPALQKAASKHAATLEEIIILQRETEELEEKYGVAKKRTIDYNKRQVQLLQEQYEKELKVYQTLEGRLRREEERAAKAKADKEWEEGAEKRMLALNKRRFTFEMQEYQAKQKVKQSAEEQLRVLGNEIALLSMIKQFGEDSFAVQRLRNEIELENFKVAQKAAGVTGEMLQNLVNQKAAALGLKQEMSEIAALAKETLAFAPVPAVAAAMQKYASRGSVSSRDPIFGDTGKSIYGKTKTGGAKKADPLGDLRKQLDLEEAMLGKTEARQRIMQALGDTYKKTSESTIVDLEKQIQLIDEVKKAEEQRLSIQQTVESAFEGGFMSMIDGTKSVTEAFKDMARQIIAELYRVMVVQRIVKTISGFLPFADGGVFSGGSQVQAFANGGVVGSPTYFPMTGGKTGLMGEAGPEAIMPLKRGKNGKLGVQVEGGGSVTVNQTINVSTGVQQTVRTEIKSLMPQIAESAKAAVADAKRRGGSYGKAF